MKKAIILIFLIFITMLITACGSSQEIYMCSDGTVAGDQQITSSRYIYVCPDARRTTDITNCYFTKQSSIDSTEAENKATDYVRGYVTANGWTTQFVNAYIEEGDWYSQLVVAKFDEQSYQTTVKIDGEKGIVTCIQNCAYTE